MYAQLYGKKNENVPADSKQKKARWALTIGLFLEFAVGPMLGAAFLPSPQPFSLNTPYNMPYQEPV